MFVYKKKYGYDSYQIAESCNHATTYYICDIKQL